MSGYIYIYIYGRLADPAFRLCDFTGKRNLTCQTAVTLKHSLHIGLAALERV